MKKLPVGVVFVVVCQSVFAWVTPDLSAEISGQFRFFPVAPAHVTQGSVDGSVALRPKASWQWDNRRQIFEVQPFGRFDSADEKRTHLDITTLSYVKAWDSIELRLGVRKVYWGVAESQHLIDIVNQTDLVEDFRGYMKLGQPMINPAFVTDWGTFEVFYLPYFRERTFPGEKGRFRTPLPVDPEATEYESGAKRWHPDFAARWSNRVDMFDIGLSYFAGTARIPIFRTRTIAGNTFLTPFYPLLQQAGADIQMTAGPFLGKLDAIAQGDKFFRNPFFGATVGGEYTIPVWSGKLDLGLLVEYLYDSRGESVFTPFENDMFFGMRLTASDAGGLALLGGCIFDLNSINQVYILEASRRFGSRWRLAVKGGVFNLTNTDPLAMYQKDSYFQFDASFFL